MRYSFDEEVTKNLYSMFLQHVKPIEKDYNFNDFLAQLDAMTHEDLN